MAFEVWSLDSRNLLATFPIEQEALVALRRELETHGQGYVAGFMLGYADSKGHSHVIAKGDALVEHALAKVPGLTAA